MVLFWQLITVVALVGLGAFFAGSETGIYCLSRFRLRLGVQQKKRSWLLLSGIIDDSHGLVLSALLGNNLTNYASTTIVTCIFLGVTGSEHTAEIYTTAIMAPLLFVFVDIVPKTIYYHRADTLVPRFAGLLWFFYKLFNLSGAVGLLKSTSHRLSHLFGWRIDPTVIATSDQSHIQQIITETRDEGILSTVQNDIMNRLIKMPQIKVASVMTPIPETVLLNINSVRDEIFQTLKQHPYTWYPVYESDCSNIIGFVNIYEILTSDADFRSLQDFVKPIRSFRSSEPIIGAINKMRNDNLKIVLVRSGRHRHRRTIGIVTMKDLVEEVTGELAQW